MAGKDYQGIKHPLVSRKKSYFDLKHKVKYNQLVKHQEKHHYLVAQKTVGSIKIADLRWPECKYEQGILENRIDVDNRKLFSWSLYDTKPTQLNEIQDTWLLVKIKKALFDNQVTKKLSKFFIDRILRLNNLDKHPEIEYFFGTREQEEKLKFSPVEAFKKLNKKYRKDEVLMAYQSEGDLLKEIIKKHAIVNESIVS